MIFPVFGSLPKGKRLERIKQSPNFRDGAFQNLSPTEVTLKEFSIVKMLKEFVNKPSSTVPPQILPSVRTDLKALPDDLPIITWFGHSSYLIKHKGLSILVDPVFSGNASPVSFFGKAFAGSDVFGTDDFGPIDLLIITHDHYDHLDYQTILTLQPNIDRICTSLGVGAHLEYWGFESGKIKELDWWESVEALAGIRLTATPARHFSGRGLKRAQALWSSFVLELPGFKLFLGGDSGYDTHFKAIGDQFGPFDLAILEIGQYGAGWPLIHTIPEETVQAGINLKAERILPVHWAKFALAMHPWNEPIQRFSKAARELELKFTTPMIGEPVILTKSYPEQTWWNF